MLIFSSIFFNILPLLSIIENLCFVKKFFVAGNHNYRFSTAKNYIHLQTTHFNINNTKAALVGFFKNLKKLKAHHFENQVFSSYIVYQPVKEAA